MEGSPSQTGRPTQTLGPPKVYGALDGGLGYTDLLGTPDAKVYVTCDPVIQNLAFSAILLWDGEELDEIPVPSGTQTPTFAIPGATLAGTRKPGEDTYTGDGLHELRYRYVYFDGTDTSDITTVRVKCSLPGGEDPNGSTAYINEGLVKPTITPSPVPDDPNVTVDVTFPRWKNIAEGDQVTVEWAGYKFPLPPVTAPDQPQLPFATLHYDDLVRAGGGQHVPVSYYIYDAAHNWSKYAPFADPTVEIDPGTLSAPKIVEATGNVLDLGELGTRDATVQVGTRALQLGDAVSVHWRGTDSNGTVQPYDPPSLTFDDDDAFILEFSIPNDIARAAAGGDVTLHYTTSSGGVSKTARYRVTDQPEVNLPAPVVPGAADGELDPFAQGAFVAIHVPFDGGQMFLGDIVTMHVVGTQGTTTRVWENGITLSSNDLKDPVPFYCPSEVLQAVDQGQATFEYDVRSATSAAWGMFSTQADERKSEVLTLAIRRAEALPPPIIGDVKDGILDPDLPQTMVEIPASASARPGTRVHLHWEGAVSTHPYSLVPSTGTLKFRVDKAFISGNRDSDVIVTYAIESPKPSDAASTVHATSEPLVFTVGAATPTLPAPSVKEAINDTIPAELDVAHLIILPQSKGNSVTVHIAAGVPYKHTLAMPDPSNPPVFELEGAAFIAPNAGTPVTATYTVTGPNYSAKSDAYTFGILPPAGTKLPLPGVVEAAAGQIDPTVASKGITVAIPASSDIHTSDDVIATVAGPGGNEVTRAQTGNPQGMNISVGPAVIAKNLARAIAVEYSVTPKAGGPAKPSPTANFSVLDFQPNDPRVGKPVIQESAGTSVLDLNQFAGDATIDIPQWPLMATGQLYWLTASTANGSQTIATAKPVTSASSFSEPLPRSWLDTLPDQTNLQLKLEIAFDGGAQATAKAFTSLTYTVHAKAAPPAFPAPDIPEAVAQQLDGNRTSATLVVPATAPLLAGDSVAASFGTHSLPAQTALPALSPFAITAAMIAAERGKTVVSTYTVTRGGAALPPSAKLSVSVTTGAEQWDSTFDFDGEKARSVSSKTQGAQLQFEDVFRFMFDRDHLPLSEQFIGVEPYTGTGVPDYYKGDILWIGHPTSHTLVNKVVLCELYKEWSEVRFAISAMDDPVTVSFQDASRKIVGTIKTLNPKSESGLHAEVRSDVVAAKKIKWIEIRCPDRILLDFFKFRK